MKSAILIQSRSTSKRLPEKAFKLIGDTPLIEMVYERCAQVHNTVYVVIPTMDKPMIEFLKERNIPFLVGEEHDVLKRYFDIAKFMGFGSVVRICGDSPFIDPANIVYALHLLDKHRVHFVSNCIEPCIDGAEVEAMTYLALQWCEINAKGKDREHVTTYIKNNIDKFVKAGFKYMSWRLPYSIKDVGKISVDTEEDLKRVNRKWEDIWK